MHQSRWTFHCCHTGWSDTVVIGIASSYFCISGSQKGRKAARFILRASNKGVCVGRVYKYNTSGVRTDLMTATMDGTACYSTSSTLLSSAALDIGDGLFFEVVSLGTPVPIGLTMAFEVGDAT